MAMPDLANTRCCRSRCPFRDDSCPTEMCNPVQCGPAGVSNNVLNAKWLEHTVLCDLPERLLGDLLREPGNHSVPGIGIAELISGSRLQRQPAHLIDHTVDCGSVSIQRLAGPQIFR